MPSPRASRCWPVSIVRRGRLLSRWRPLSTFTGARGPAWTAPSGAPHSRALAACGLVVASLDFRQGPAHQHPAASADVAAGVRYVRAHAGHLGVDPRRIGLLGSSSGGQLALLVAVKPGVPEHAGTPIVRPDGPLDNASGDDSVAFVMALYPVADPLARYRYALSRQSDPAVPGGFNAAGLIAGHRATSRTRRPWRMPALPESLPRARPRPCLQCGLAQPGSDDNVPAAITDALVQAYEKAGGRIERVRFPGAAHSFIQRPGADTDKCIALMREFVGQCVREIEKRSA